MSKRDVRLFVSDILESIEKIQKWTQGMSYEKFSQDLMIQDAVVRNLEIVGEAAKISLKTFERGIQRYLGKELLDFATLPFTIILV